jgi:hypothetical protein
VVSSTEYAYFVAAVNIADDQNPGIPTSSQSSNIADGNTPAIGAAPSTPTGLEIAGQTGDTSIPLQWTGSTGGSVPVDHYLLYRSLVGLDQFAPVLTATPISSTQNVFTDTQLTPSTGYDYRLVAVSATGTESGYCELDDQHNIAATTTFSQTVAAPTGLTPVLTISSPAPSTDAGVSVNWDLGTSTDNRITKTTQILGIIDDLDQDLTSWQLKLTPLGASTSTQPVILATNETTGQMYIGSSVTTTDGLICTIDPSQYPAGQYVLSINATYGTITISNAASTPVSVSLASDVQLGNLTLPFTDLTVNVPGGQPITVSRVYNSQNANVLGDFGDGWNLDTSTETLTTTATPASAGGPEAFQPGDLVYITLPGGQQYTFQFFPVTADYNSSTAPDPYSQF